MTINSSAWTNLNQNIEILSTKKKFYNQYLFKIEYRVPGASLLTYSSVKNLKSLTRSVSVYNQPSRQAYRWIDDDPAKVDTLVDFFNFKTNIDRSMAKIRIEKNSFCVYSNDHQYLLDTAQTTLSKHAGMLRYVYLIKSPGDQILLDQGHIIVKKPKTYPYRVRLNYGSYKDFAGRESLARYIEHLGDDVRISKNLLEELKTNNKYFHGGYLYLKDPNVANMLKFISPTIVGKTHQMTQG